MSPYLGERCVACGRRIRSDTSCRCSPRSDREVDKDEVVDDYDRTFSEKLDDADEMGAFE